MKTLIFMTFVISAIVSSAYASENGYIAGNNTGSVEGKTVGNAEGRGVATFSMNFSASANTKGNFDADGMGQNLFYGNGYNTPYYGNAPYYNSVK